MNLGKDLTKLQDFPNKESVFLVYTMNKLQKTKSQSVQLSERSSSRNKIMIPKTQKLKYFFRNNQNNEKETQSTDSTQYMISRNNQSYLNQKNKMQQNKLNNVDVNLDYFDQDTNLNFIKQIRINVTNKKISTNIPSQCKKSKIKPQKDQRIINSYNSMGEIGYTDNNFTKQIKNSKNLVRGSFRAIKSPSKNIKFDKKINQGVLNQKFKGNNRINKEQFLYTFGANF